MSDDALRKELMEVFAEESAGLLERLDASLAELRESRPAAEDSGWRALERCLHTLKGASEALGAEQIAREAHAAESLIATFAAEGGEVVPLLDALEDRALRLRTMASEFCSAPDGTPSPPPAPSAKGEEQVARPAPSAKGEEQVARPAPSGVSPRAEEERPTPAPPPASPPRDSSSAGSRQTSSAAARPAGATSAALRASSDFLRVKPERVDEMHGLVGELAATRRRFSDVGVELKVARRALSRVLRNWRGLKARVRPLRNSLPDGARWGLDQSTEALGGQLVALQRQLSTLGREVHGLEAQATATTSSLEDGIQELRLMALEPFLDLFRPSVREAAELAGCRAQLVVEAHGTEVDRLVLLKLRDPLLHLVRNAVAHGIEAPEARRRAGKPDVGTVRLEAETEGNRARIRVVDDGRGIDVARVREKALKAGLISSDEQLDEPRLLGLLLQPGFSSKESVDTLAGRGIGMDVVGDVVQSLDGQLTLSNRPGQGCTFALDVPVTTSSGRGLIARCGADLFGFLSYGIERVVRLSPDDVHLVHGQSTILVGESPVALARLDALLGLPSSPAQENEKLLCLVLRQGTQRLGLIIDEVFREDELQVKPLGGAFAGAKLFLGAAIQADGRVVPVLRTAACLERAGALPGYAPPRREVAAVTRVLVVDDSLTMRTMLRNILHSAGYEVTLANNGQHALDVLQSLEGCALVLTDLEMPEMDGFQLCAAIRRGALPNLPVLVISSLASQRDIERALEAGADGYVVKAELRQAAFLQRVAELAGKEPSS